MSIMEIKEVRYSYDNKRNVLKGVSAELEAGKMYAILGPSGCGKTTLLSLLGGLDSPIDGQILYQGEDIAKTGLANHRRSHVAFIFQSYDLIDYLTPMENVALTSKLPPMPILEQLGLTPEEAKRNVLKLSGGQQQRVAIARALASDAQVLLADEPTGNLDEDTAAEITGILKECAHKSGKCVVIVTHSNELAKSADVIMRLRKGDLQILDATDINTGKGRKTDMKKFVAGKNENAPDLTQDEKAHLRSVFCQIRLLPQKAKEISQKIQERQMKMADSRGADRR